MNIWVGVDSTGVPQWHTAAETRDDCRDLIAETYREEGDVLLSAQHLNVSWQDANASVD